MLRDGLFPALHVSPTRFASRWTDRQLATALGALYFALTGWPLLFLRVPPYQDLPDHLATVCVLMQPERYPEFISNGWFKANSLFVALTFLLAKAIGVLGAGRVVCLLVVGATSFALPHFVLAMTDRRRLLVASLFMAPMVHNWWILMGMLNFALAFPLGLGMLLLLARQAETPTKRRAAGIAALAILLWFTHAVTLLLVILLASVEAVVRGDFRRPRVIALRFAPLVPVVLLLLSTIARHASETTATGALGRAGEEAYQTNFSAVYDLWAHEFFGLTPLTVSGIVPALALVYFAAKNARAPTAMFSQWALAALGAIYWFFPFDLPGFGFVCERALPFMWIWALLRVPDRLPHRLSVVLAAASVAWAAGLAVDLFRAGRDLDEFAAAAPFIPEADHLLTLNFEPRVSSRNTWSLLHASGLYTVLRGAHPQDAWADSPSMPIRRTETPAFVEDPVAVRMFLSVAETPAAYCAATTKSRLLDLDCRTRWADAWASFWTEAQVHDDDVLLWGASPEVLSTVPESYVRQMDRGRLQLLAKSLRPHPLGVPRTDTR